jgi:hypothetical protein
VNKQRINTYKAIKTQMNCERLTIEDRLLNIMDNINSEQSKKTKYIGEVNYFNVSLVSAFNRDATIELDKIEHYKEIRDVYAAQSEKCNEVLRVLLHEKEGIEHDLSAIKRKIKKIAEKHDHAIQEYRLVCAAAQIKEIEDMFIARNYGFKQ